MNADQKGMFKQLSEKISMELVFAEVGKDSGLLPINSLLGQIEELPLAAGGQVWVDAVKFARKWIDQVFDTTATFDESTLRLLGEWGTWAQNAGDAWLTGGNLPPMPAHWGTAVAQSSTPATAPVATATGTAAPTQEAQAPLIMNIDSDGDLLREFTNESQEHLQNIEQGVLVLEDQPKDRDTLNSIFRAFHTFKGGSGLLNLMPMNRTAHELENLLDLARQDKLEITIDIINLILEGGDVLKQYIDEMNEQLSGKRPPGPILVHTQDLLTRVRAAVTGSKIPPAQAAKANPPATPASSTQLTPTSTAIAPETPAAPAPAAPAQTGKAAQGGGNAATGAVVKVDTLKLDSLVDLVGEMVIAQSMVQLDPEVTRLSNQNLNRNLAQLGRITKELQRIAMSMRMVPIRPTFQKMNRLVRDVCAKQGKQVDLVLVGEDTELDRTIVEEISDPLVHMIRNAVDHGIEMPDTRTKAGKAPQGTILLSAYHQGGNIVIQIKDDGGGLRKDKILKKAVENGILRPDQQLPDKEIFDLIFAPGFSTADKVTDISGRGVGMDVVKRNIEKLRGKVEIDSIEGKGSTFNIYLPLTLAIIDGLVISIGNERYILPTLSVRESFRPTADMLSTVHERGEMVNVRGRLYPLLRLYEAFNIEPQTKNPEESIVIVIEAGQDVRCLLVDQLLGKQEVVIKSLGETFKANPAIAGAAIMGDGRVGLILDVNTLVRVRQMQVQPKAA
jgi:two-component system chemotaxis sensor kinase CheA